MKNSYNSIAKKKKKKKKKTKPDKPIKNCSEDLNRPFFKEHMQKASRHMKRRSGSLIFKEMPISITMRYHLTPVRMAIIKKTGSKCWRGCGETLCRVGRDVTGTATTGAVWRFHKNQKWTTVWSSISTSGCLSEENENTNTKRYPHSRVHCSIAIFRIWE